MHIYAFDHVINIGLLKRFLIKHFNCFYSFTSTSQLSLKHNTNTFPLTTPKK